jgi:hypothetical protein
MASLIEEFLYKFTADTAEYTDATNKVGDSNKKAVDTMKQTDASAAQLAGQFKTLALGALGAAAAFLSFAGIKAVAVAAAEQTDALDKTARALRMSADDLDVWQRANEAAGGSASEMAATFKMLQERTRDPIKALEDIADRFKGLNDLQADRLGASLGLDKGTIEMMRQGKAGLVEFIAVQQKLGKVTEEQLAAAKEWKLQTKLSQFVMDDIARMIMAKLIPGATEWLKTMRGALMWMRDNKEFTLAFFGAIATVLTARLIPALLAAGLAAAPWILLATAVAAVGAAIALVVDDMLAFEDGSKSMIGEISKSWPVVGQIVHVIVDALKVLGDVAGAVFKFLRDAIFEPANALENLEARLGAIMAAFETRFPKLAALVQVLGAGIGAYFSVLGSVFSAVFDGIMNVGKAIAWVAEKIGITGVLKGVGNAVLAQLPAATGAPGERYQSPDTSTPKGLAAAREAMQEQRTETPLARTSAAVQAGRAAVTNAESSPLASTTSNAISNTVNNKPVTKTTQVTTGPITVNTQATDGKEVAAALGKGLAAQTKSAVDEADNGIAI